LATTQTQNEEVTSSQSLVDNSSNTKWRSFVVHNSSNTKWSLVTTQVLAMATVHGLPPLFHNPQTKKQTKPKKKITKFLF
jgi:hypothetical protein